MRIGVPKEIKNNEFRIGLTPAGVTELAHAGHEVLVERGGGASLVLTTPPTVPRVRASPPMPRRCSPGRT
jgi:hypothetical protein